MIHRLTLFFFLSFTVPVLLLSQTGRISGRVFDSNTREPLHLVYVLYGKGAGTSTGEDGTFSFNAAPGRYTISFQLLGYRSATREVSIDQGQEVNIEATLEPMAREIDQVVVSANRTEQKIAELSVSMKVIKPFSIYSGHITDAQELITKTSGIEVMDGQASIRGGSGFSYGAGSRVLALIDGLPVLSADAGNIKWQFLPFENLSQIEIIKGASSVLYGSSALNGIINFRTEDASNTPSTRFFAETGIFGKPAEKEYIWWDTPRVFSSLSFSHLRKLGKNDIGVSMNLMADEGYRRLNGEKLARINMKLKHFSGKVEGLTYGLNINSGFTAKKDFVLWEDASSGALMQSPTTASDFRGDFLALDPYITYKKTGSFQHDFRMRAQSSRNRNPDREQNNSDALSMYSEYQLWIKLNRITDLTAGAGINMVKVNSPFFGDHTAGNQAGFAQLELKPFSKLKAVAGVRVERFSLDRTEDKTVPIFRAGLNFQAAEFTWLRASFGQGFRYPSIAEKFAATTLGSIIIIANPSLLSESGWSSEAGVKQGLSLGQFTGQADLSVFYTRNSNLIEYMFGAYPEGIGFRATNREESLVWGTELELVLAEETGKLKSSVSAAWTYINPVELNPLTGKETGAYLKYRRKHSAMLAWSASLSGFEWGLSSYYRSKILAIDDVFLTTPILPGFNTYWPEHNTGYILLDGSVGYRLSQRLRISLAVKNITNTEYMGRPGDIQPHRNYSLRFSGSF